MNLADFLAKQAQGNADQIDVIRVPIEAKQADNEFKTWQLHYAIVVRHRGRSETFSYCAGYGLAEAALKKRYQHPSLSRASIMQDYLARWRPTAVQVLECLRMDAECGAYSFEEFCGNCGYDEDSREAERTWRACADTARKLRSLLGATLFAEFMQTTEGDK